MPVAFIPHGGGPWPFVDVGLGSKEELAGLATYLKGLATLPPQPPRALLVVSAHWEAAVPTVSTSAEPPLLCDYYGFPPASYALAWPAPGEPTLAAHVRSLLGHAGFSTAEDPVRGFDHGVFVPLKLAYPAAQVPTVALSLKKGLDPQEHLNMGRALLPLRDEGVFIVGSGMSYHNLRAFGPEAKDVAARFDAWLCDAVQRPSGERNALLVDWARAPEARKAHPREEHLLPLMVVAGAAGDDPACVPYNGTLLDLKLMAAHFG